MNNHFIKPGAQVNWKDPGYISSGIYTVDDCPALYELIEPDDIVLISSEDSEVQVYARELFPVLEEDENGEHLCICNNCMTILFDENPQVDAKKYKFENIVVEMMDKDEDGAWACPICGTDNYLIDL